MLVLGAQKSQIAQIIAFLWREDIGAEHHTVGVFKHQPPRRAGLTPQLGDARRNIDVEIRIGCQHASNPAEVFGIAPDMGADEGDAGIGRNAGLQRSQKAFEAGKFGAVKVPVRIFDQFLDPLVVGVERLEEGRRISDVHQNR